MLNQRAVVLMIGLVSVLITSSTTFTVAYAQHTESPFSHDHDGVLTGDDAVTHSAINTLTIDNVVHGEFMYHDLHPPIELVGHK